MLILFCAFDAVECVWTEKQRQLATWAFSHWKFYQYTSLRVGTALCLPTVVAVIGVITVVIIICTASVV